jgi:hypothetical protein
MYDALDILQPLVTVSVTQNGTGLNLLTNPGTPRRGLVARVRVTAQSAATVGPTVIFTVQQSPDNATWTNMFSSDPITPGVTPSAILGEVLEISLPFVMTKQYCRLIATFSQTTGSPLITYASELGVSWPG